MTTGTLTSVMGPMYAGKTSELMKRILWLNHLALSVMVIKPAIDDRYSKNREIVTHTGHKFECHYLFLDKIDQDKIANDNLVLQDASKMHSVFVDEIQFFDSEIISIIEEWLTSGVDVVVSGLDQDSTGAPFLTSAQLLAMSDEVVKLKSYCNTCGQPATKTQKLFDTGKQIDVGSSGMYEARCLKHWQPRK